MKPPTPAELAGFEHAFAADPSSEAYRPLTEAYLAMGRFMEAMVVCKKGVKAHPSDLAPRLLLARIYAAQGKDRKALEELEGALAVRPGDAEANRTAGLLHLKLGEKERGTAALRKAWETAPADPATLEAMQQWGLDFSAPATPPAAPRAASVATPPPVLQPVSRGAGAPLPGPLPGARAEGDGRPSAPRAEGTGRPAAPRGQGDATQGAAGQGNAAPAPAARPAEGHAPAEAARSAAYADELAARYATQDWVLESHGEVRAARPRSRAPLLATVGLGVALLLVLGVWFGLSSVRRARAVEIDRLLRQSRELIEKDGYASYREAARLCERILERDPDALGGHAYLAYVDALRWGEHGESESLREEARKHLDAVGRLGQPHSHAYAAEAYLRAYGGDVRGALEQLRRVMAGPEGGSALLHGVLGALALQAGELDAARDDLTWARQNAPGDVRVTALLAEQWRRRGPGHEIQAGALYDTALARLVPDHVPSLLGKAQLLLAAGQADEALKRIDRVLGMGPNASPRQVAVAHALRGSALHAQGKAADGDAEEQQAIALDPADGEIHDLVGRRKLRAGDAAGAAAAFRKAADLEPTRVGFHADLAAALLQKPGGAPEAAAALEQASARVGGARLAKLLGDAWRAAGDGEKARAAYERALTLEPKNADARIALARLWRDRKDFPKALEELDRAVKDSSEAAAGGAAAAWIEIGETEELRGDPRDAVEKAYTSALKADPQSCPALFWLGRSRADRAGRYDPSLAKQMLQDYLRLCPRGARAGEAQRIVASL
ncbi:tetratricopeptide repeat protein [Anaeromyxobacter diazotrophicus]|nr:tetratricopeptide repeat protein [Anaeromyxobacter diazotrophicus]